MESTGPVGRRAEVGQLPPWRPPEPRELPEWRASMREYLGTDIGQFALATALNAGQATLVPRVLPEVGASAGAVASVLLSRAERERLRQARLYFVTGDMTALALAAAATPPAEPVRAKRLPSPYGLMLFAEPLGGYTMQLVEDGGPVPVPIVAVSWGTWTPHDVTVPGARVEWLAKQSDGLVRIPAEYEGVWLTFYAPEDGAAYAAMDPDAVVGADPDGNPTTAGQLLDVPRMSPLGWDHETLLAYGATFEPPPPNTTAEWSQTVYTAWQLITQGGSRLAETEEVPRPRAGRKRDARDGIEDGGVRVVNVHAAHRPSRAATAEDAEASDGRRPAQYSCRWPVRPHRRDHCMNPRAHADSGCHHEERIIPAHIRGPADKPLRVSETVHLWDRQPAAESAEGERR